MTALHHYSFYFKQSHFVLLVVAILIASSVFVSQQFQAEKTVNSVLESEKDGDFGSIPLSFVPSMGQSHPQIKYQAIGESAGIYFDSEGITFPLPTLAAESAAVSSTVRRNLNNEYTESITARISFINASSTLKIRSLKKLPGIVNYFIGNDPSNWQTNLPTFSGIAYKQIYPGIDLEYDGSKRQLKGTYFVLPGADPGHIQWAYKNATNVYVDKRLVAE